MTRSYALCTISAAAVAMAPLWNASGLPQPASEQPSRAAAEFHRDNDVFLSLWLLRQLPIDCPSLIIAPRGTVAVGMLGALTGDLSKHRPINAQPGNAGLADPGDAAQAWSTFAREVGVDRSVLLADLLGGPAALLLSRPIDQILADPSTLRQAAAPAATSFALVSLISPATAAMLRGKLDALPKEMGAGMPVLSIERGKLAMALMPVIPHLPSGVNEPIATSRTVMCVIAPADQPGLTQLRLVLASAAGGAGAAAHLGPDNSLGEVAGSSLQRGHDLVVMMPALVTSKPSEQYLVAGLKLSRRASNPALGARARGEEDALDIDLVARDGGLALLAPVAGTVASADSSWFARNSPGASVALEQRFGPPAASARFAMLLGPRFDGTLRGSAPAAFGPGRRLLVTSGGMHNNPPAGNPREHIWIATQLSADVTSTADALIAADVLLPNLATLLELGNTSGSARREQPFAAGARQQSTGDAPAAPTEPTRESPAPLRMPKGLPVDAVRSLHLTLDATSPFAQRISATPVMTWNVHADSSGERWLVATIGDGQTAPDGPTPSAAAPRASGLASDDLAGRRIVDLAVRFVEDGGGDGYAPNFSPHSTQARLALGPLQGGLGPVSRIGRWLTWQVDAQADGSVRGRGTLGLRAMAMPGAAVDVHNASPAGK